MIELWIVLLASGALTFLTRLSFISLLANRDIPPVVLQALRFVPPAVLTAIVFPEILLRDGEIAIAADNFRLSSGLIAILVAWRFTKIFLTIATGMATLWLLQWLGI
jgi:branched-subunit amino acid transport protein